MDTVHQKNVPARTIKEARRPCSSLHTNRRLGNVGVSHQTSTHDIRLFIAHTISQDATGDNKSRVLARLGSKRLSSMSMRVPSKRVARHTLGHRREDSKISNLNTPDDKDGNSSRGASLRPAKVPTTPREQLRAISSHFHTVILPQCEQFTTEPPTDRKEKDSEHKRLNETIMNEVLLRLDAVETAEDQVAREVRWAFAQKTQTVLRNMDKKLGYLVEREVMAASADDTSSKTNYKASEYIEASITEKMKDLCRKDDSRGGIRQCAYYQCGKWEEFTRQFAKCRRCRRTKYCSKECQKSAWVYHRNWCIQAAQ